MDLEKYLKENNAQKQIDKLAKKCKNKRVIFYGAGAFFRLLKDNYDISKFNIVGISDLKYEYKTIMTEYGFKTYEPDELVMADYDVIILAVLWDMHCITNVRRIIEQRSNKIKTAEAFELKNIKYNNKIELYPMIIPTIPYLIKSFFNKEV